MKRSGFRRPTGEKLRRLLERQRARRAESAQRYQDRIRDEGGRKPIPPVNRERRKRLDAEQFGAVAESIRKMPCCACRPELYRGDRPLPEPGERKISEASHTKTRGSGGKKHQQVPHCREHHRLFESWGRTRDERHHEHFGVHTGRVAARIHRELGGAS